MKSLGLSTFQRWALLIFLVNLALGLIFCFVLFPRFFTEELRLDPDGYGEVGRLWHEGGSFEAVNKAPLYPAFIALVSGISDGYNVRAIQAAQCWLLAVTCVLVYVIFSQAMEEPSARWAGMICAIFPMFLWYVPRLWTEVFLTLVMASYTAVLNKFLRQPSIGLAVLCGLVIGLAALTKGIALIFFIITPLVCLLKFRRQALRWIVILAFTIILILTPWTWRNWKLAGRFIPVHINLGYNFLLGNGFARNWQSAPMSYTRLKELTLQDHPVLAEVPLPAFQDSARQDEILLSIALKEIFDLPVLVIRKLFVGVLAFWYLAADRTKSILTGVVQIPFVILAIPGVIAALRQRSDALVLLVPVIGIMGGAW